VKHHIKALVGVTADVHVVETDKVERTLVGKARRVIDKRPK
jgi:phenylacetate-CoA ligase